MSAPKHPMLNLLSAINPNFFEMLKSQADKRNKGFIQAVEKRDIPGMQAGLDCYRFLVKSGQQNDMKNTVAKAMMIAAENGFVDVIDELLKNDVPVDFDLTGSDEEGGTALMVAANAGHYPMVAHLIKNGADPKKSEKTSRNTALHYACLKNHTLIAALLLRGSDVNSENIGNATPLILAVSSDNTQLIERILKAGANINQETKEGFTALTVALQYSIKTFQFLLNQPGINVDKQDKNGDTALVLALSKPDPKEKIEALFKAGAKLQVNEALLKALSLQMIECSKLLILSPHLRLNELRDIDGISLLQAGVELRLPEILQSLLDRKANLELTNREGNTPLAQAAFLRDLPIVEFLIKAKANVNAMNPRTKLSALTCAVEKIPPQKLELFAQQGYVVDLKNTLPVVERLLEAKAMIEQPAQRSSALMAAVYSQEKESVKRLLAEKAEVNFVSPDPDSRSPLALAAALNDTETVELLLEKSADINLPVCGSTALGFATGFNAVESIQILLKAKADINQNGGDYTPLMTACITKNTTLVKQLLEQKAEVDVRDSLQATALMHAVRVGHTGIVQLLLAAGADPNCTTVNGLTAIRVAVDNNCPEIVKLLLEKKTDIKVKAEMSLINSACFNGSTENLTMLIKAGADVNAEDDFFVTPFFAAAVFDNVEALELYYQTGKIDLQQTFLGPYTYIDFVKSPEAFRYLRSIGVTGEGLGCMAILMFLIMEGESPVEIEEYLELFDCSKVENHLDTYQDKNGEEKPTPLFLYANHSKNLAIKNLILKHKLISDCKEIERGRIELFVKHLTEVCQNFSFSEEGALCISLTRKKRSYQITLTQRGLLALFRTLDDQSIKTRLDQLMFDYTEERLELKEELEIQTCKDHILTRICTAFKDMHSGQETLQRLQKQIKTIIDPSKEIQELKFIQDRYLDYSKKFHASLDDWRNGHFVEIGDKSKLLDFKQKIDKLAEEFLTLVQRLKAFNNVVVEKLGHTTHAHTEKPKTSAAPSQKSKKQLNKKAEKAKETKAAQDFEDACSAALDFFKGSNFEKVSKPIQIEQAQLEQQPSKVIPKQNPVFPKKEITKIYDHEAVKERCRESRKYLKIPERSVDSVTNLFSRLKAQEGVSTLTSITPNLQNANTNTELGLLMDYSAALGALGQALDARKGLNEEWPNHVRNIIFHHERALKRFDKKAVIENIQMICQNLKKITPAEESQTLGCISLKSIDANQFLEKLSRMEIPALSREEAEENIKKADAELKPFVDYLLQHKKEVIENKQLKMAMGFCLTRIGTCLNEFRDKFKGHPMPNTTFGKYTLTEIGNAFRHFDPTWESRVDAFMQKILNRDVSAKVPISGPISSAPEPVSNNTKKLEGKKN